MKSTRRNACRAARGLTLLELMLALSVTAMVATAIAGMMRAVAVGASTNSDVRSVMVRGSTAQARISSYLATARCVLQVDSRDGLLVIWQNDDRPNNTINVSEVRWLVHDAGTDQILMKLIDWPDSWTQAQRELQDAEFAAAANWRNVLAGYEKLNWIVSIPLVDGVKDASITLDRPACLDARLVYVDLEVETEAGSRIVRVNSPILTHYEPEL